MLIQVLLLVFFAFAAIKAIARFLARDITLANLVYWIIFWLAAGVIVIWPDATFYLANILGIGRGADLVVYVSLVIIFFLIFRLMIAQERQRREITELTRLLAMKDEGSYGDR